MNKTSTVFYLIKGCYKNRLKWQVILKKTSKITNLYKFIRKELYVEKSFDAAQGH